MFLLNQGSLLVKCFLFCFIFLLPHDSFSSSSESDVFSESAFWSPTLNSVDRTSGYEDMTVDDWHSEMVPKLKRVYDIYNKPNVAVARLTFVFQGKDEVWKDEKVALNKVFFSGWPLPSHSSGQDTNFFVQRVFGAEYFAYVLKEYYREHYPDEKWPDIAYFGYLKSLFDFTKDGEEYDKLPDEMKKRFVETYALIEAGSDLDALKSRFYDTEPLIFLDCDNKIILTEMLGKVEGKVAHIIIDIASYKDMCFDCRDVGFIQSKFLRGFSEKIIQFVRESMGFRSGVIAFNGYVPKVVIRISSQEETTMYGNRRMTTRKDKTYRFLRGMDTPLREVIIADRIFLDTLNGYIIQRHF